MFCYVMLCYVMLRYVMLCYVMLRFYVMFCYVMLRYFMLRYVALCYGMLCCVMLCYVALCCVVHCNDNKPQFSVRCRRLERNDLQTQYMRTNIGFRLGFLCSKTIYFMKNSIIKIILVMHNFLDFKLSPCSICNVFSFG